MSRTVKKITLINQQEVLALCGQRDEHLKFIERELGMKINARGNDLLLSGVEEEVKRAIKLFDGLIALIRSGEQLHQEDVKWAISSLKNNRNKAVSKILAEKIEVFSSRHYIKPKTPGQKEYVEAIRKYDIVFGIGPAGTGKTYLAMAMAVSALKKKEVSRIMLTRPAVEAGEKLGFLPGDLYEKVTPYLRPLYDALYDMMEVENIQKFLESGIIEVAPLAYMRGRTLNDSFIILDEAQNSTPDQMKMFLTRLGFDSKTVITGDITQVDLPMGRQSGLIQVQSVLKKINGIKFIYFTGRDVVRHELVQQIIKAYEESEKDSHV